MVGTDLGSFMERGQIREGVDGRKLALKVWNCWKRGL